MGKSNRKSLQRREQDRLRDVLKAARQEKSFTRRGLSLKLGMPATYVARIERGERSIDVIEFVDLAKALDADPVELLTSVLETDH